MRRARYPWTPALLIEKGVQFYRTYGRLPTCEDCRLKADMPAHHTVYRHFAALGNYHAAILAHLGDVPATVTPVPVLKPTLAARPCLKCDAPFVPRRKELRVCDACKNTDAWRREDGDTGWMNGDSITLKGALYA